VLCLLSETRGTRLRGKTETGFEVWRGARGGQRSAERRERCPIMNVRESVWRLSVMDDDRGEELLIRISFVRWAASCGVILLTDVVV
jgi:hypothetical protein